MFEDRRYEDLTNRLTILEIWFKLKDFNDNKSNDFPIHSIPALNVSDTDQDSDKSDEVRMKKIVCAVSVRLAVSNERVLLLKKKVNNKLLSETAIVNGDCYKAMLNKFLFTKIAEEDIGNVWFQQDGPTCHTAEATLYVLRPVFEDCIISRRANVVWSPWSCDLTPLDYYLWGAVKDKCYVDKPETIDVLKDNIREAIGEIQLHTIDNVLKNWKRRLLHSQPRQAFE